MPGQLITIATFATAAEASLAQTTLEENGIRAYVQGGTTADTLWQVATTSGGVELQVASTDVATALECLGWSESAEPSKPVDAWNCGSCGEDVDAGFEVCWNCGAGIDDVPGSRAPVAEPPSTEDERTISCPMCGERLPEEAEDCPHCGERFDGVSFDDPTELDADGEESYEARRVREALTRAFRAAMFGLVIFPPFLTIYAIFQLAEYRCLRIDYGFPINWRARVAIAANMLALVESMAILWLIFSSPFG